MNSLMDAAALRKSTYALLITVAAGMVTGHILSVARLYEPHLFRDETDAKDQRGTWPKARPEPMPTHGDNDRSRWVTVRALVENGTYVIGHREFLSADRTRFKDSGLITEPGWNTIDKVLRPDTNDFYSSKPPLLATLLAGEYWVLHRFLGWSIVPDRWLVVRTILMTVNGLPWVLFLVLLSRLLERLGSTDWGRLYVLTAACFGTLLTPFAITLNNHSVAACSALFALYPTVRIWYDGQDSPWLYSLAGFFAAFTAACELPAAAATAAFFALLTLRSPARTLAFFLPAALVPVAAFLLTNYLAIGQLQPAYDNFGSVWYEFQGSHWEVDPSKPKTGIDWAYLREGRAVYGFHLLFGHHGLFSLSPIFLLAAAGMVASLAGRRGAWDGVSDEGGAEGERRWPRALALLTLFLTVVVLAFYILIVQDRNRNYGGWTNGARWLIWLTPFWLLTMQPVADWLSPRRWGRGLAYALLAVSVFTASYQAWNPWRQPWLYYWLEALDCIHY
jgi:hypothetical protein